MAKNQQSKNASKQKCFMLRPRGWRSGNGRGVGERLGRRHHRGDRRRLILRCSWAGDNSLNKKPDKLEDTALPHRGDGRTRSWSYLIGREPEHVDDAALANGADGGLRWQQWRARSSRQSRRSGSRGRGGRRLEDDVEVASQEG